MNEPTLKKAMDTLEFLSQDREARRRYEERQKYLHDEASMIEWATEKGMAEGMATVVHPFSEVTKKYRLTPMNAGKAIFSYLYTFIFLTAFSAASITTSPSVGWGWMVIARSSTVAPISIAKASSDIRVEASTPTICAPMTMPDA